MIRVLICGTFEDGWRKEVNTLLSRSWEDYCQGVDDGRLPPENPRLPQLYPTFVQEEKEVAWQISKVSPQVLISVKSKPPALLLLNHQDRLKWYHYEAPPGPADLKRTVYEIYLGHAFYLNKGEDAAPLVSVFTPTYNSGPHLVEAYRSLAAQTYRNWEWVLVDDGSTDKTPETIAGWASFDSRIRLFRPVDRNYGNIGRIKRYATGLCLGKYLVELDHDDLLTEDALTEVVSTFEADPDLGFVYSNFAEFIEGGGDHYYPDWEDRGRYRRTLYNNRYYLEALAYDVYGDVDDLGPVIKEMSVCPNHVRAFRRTELDRIGGYNPRLVMGDDFDLMIRMFCLSKIKHIAKLLYLYRIHSNTWARFNEFARFLFPVIRQRWEPDIDRRINELKGRGQWLPEPQGRRRG